MGAVGGLALPQEFFCRVLNHHPDGEPCSVSFRTLPLRPRLGGGRRIHPSRSNQRERCGDEVGSFQSMKHLRTEDVQAVVAQVLSAGNSGNGAGCVHFAYSPSASCGGRRTIMPSSGDDMCSAEMPRRIERHDPAGGGEVFQGLIERAAARDRAVASTSSSLYCGFYAISRGHPTPNVWVRDERGEFMMLLPLPHRE